MLWSYPLKARTEPMPTQPVVSEEAEPDMMLKPVNDHLKRERERERERERANWREHTTVSQSQVVSTGTAEICEARNHQD